MKPILLLPVFIVAVAGGVVGNLLLGDSKPEPRDESVLQPVRDAAPAAKPEVTKADLEALRLELASLRQDIRGLQVSQSRTPAGSPEEVEDELLAALADSLPGEQEQIIKSVIQKERDERREAQLEERRVRREEWIHTRATQIANELGLAAGDEQRLAAIYIQENEKMTEMRNQLEELGWGPESRQQMRTLGSEIRTWRETELTNAFGTDMAGQIQDMGGMGTGRMGGGNRGGRGGRNSGDGAAPTGGR